MTMAEHTKQSRPVYMVIAGETRDRARMAQYSRALAASGLYERLGGYYVNTPRPVAVFEGPVPDDFVTLVVRFPSLDAAQQFWNSPQYQNDVKPLRLNPSAGDYSVTVYEEADLPSYMKGRVHSGSYTR